MTHPEALLGTAIGIWAVTNALWGRGDFHAVGPGQRATSESKPIPQWFGRLWFLIIGGLFLYWGIPSLRGPWHRSDLYGGLWITFFILTVWAWGKLRKGRSSGE